MSEGGGRNGKRSHSSRHQQIVTTNCMGWAFVRSSFGVGFFELLRCSMMR